jgi:UV DNA damage repair endonuclease
MPGLTEGNHSRCDIALLNWGQHEASARATHQEVFEYRMGYVRSMFEEMGFSSDDLEMRVQTMVFFQTMESSKYTRLSKKERIRHVQLRHQMLIAK